MKIFESFIFKSFMLSAAVLGISWNALAARTASVDVDSVDLLKGPQKNAEILGKLKKGQKLWASNYPTGGYYKVKNPVDGTMGWVKADTLELGPLPKKAEEN